MATEPSPRTVIGWEPLCFRGLTDRASAITPVDVPAMVFLFLTWAFIIIIIIIIIILIVEEGALSGCCCPTLEHCELGEV